MNVVVLIGTLHRAPEVRVLPSGSEVLSFDLATSLPDGRSDVVPVSLPDPPGSLGSLGPGTEVIVGGRVHRRFFRVGGSTQSRTEVLAEQVVPLRQPKRSQAVLARAREHLAGAPVPTRARTAVSPGRS